MSPSGSLHHHAVARKLRGTAGANQKRHIRACLGQPTAEITTDFTRAENKRAHNDHSHPGGGVNARQACSSISATAIVVRSP